MIDNGSQQHGFKILKLILKILGKSTYYEMKVNVIADSENISCLKYS
jgi:hypothetical protein